MARAESDDVRTAVFMVWVLAICLNLIFIGYGTDDFPNISWASILILTPIYFLAISLTYLLLFYQGTKPDVTDCPYCESNNLRYVGIVSQGVFLLNTLELKAWECMDCTKPIHKRHWDADNIIMTSMVTGGFLFLIFWIILIILGKTPPMIHY